MNGQLALSEEKKRRMDAVMAALEADRMEAKDGASCPTCKRVLKVTKMPKIGTTIVSCEVGCTNAKFSYDPA